MGNASPEPGRGSEGARPARRLVADTRVHLLVFLTALGAAVRFAGLGRQSFWIDETVTAELLSKPFHGMLAALPDWESTPPLYYVLAWFWSELLGSGELSLRSLSALAGTLTIPVAYAAGRALVCRRTGMIVAALAAVSPLLVWYSQEARAYSLFVLLAALSLLFFGRALTEPSPRALGWWAVASSLSVLTHYFGIFLVAAEAVMLLVRHRRRATWMATAAIAGVCLALLPLAAYQVAFSSSRWIRSVDLRLRIEEAMRQLLLPSEPSIWAGAGVPEDHARAWWPAGLLLLAAGLVAALLLGSARQRRGSLVALGLGAAALCVPIAGSLASTLLVDGRGDVFLFRNVVAAWLPLTIVLAAGLAARRAGRLGVVLAGVMVALSAAVLVVNSTTSHLQRDDWRLLARATDGPGRAIIVSPSWELGALEFYRPELREFESSVLIREIDVLARRQSPSYSPPVRVLVPPPAFRKVETRRLQSWNLTRFRAGAPVRLSHADLLDFRPRGASAVVLIRNP